VTTPGSPDEIGQVHEMVPGEPEPVRSIEVGEMIFGLAVTPTDLWVVGEQDGGALWRVDKASGAVTTIGQFRGVDQVLVYADAVWLTSRLTGRLWKLNPADGSVLAEVSISTASGMAVHDGSIWVTTYNEGMLLNIDPATAEIISSERLPYAYLHPPISAFGSLWTSALENNLVMRIDPGT
jgi:streptogramin lyase